VFIAAIVLLVVNAPGWPEVKQAFFNREIFRESLPGIASAFLTNVKIFCFAEAVILFTALGLAVLRSLQGPVFFPLRALAIVYADFFRGVPTILLVYLLGFGIPALDLPYGISDPELLWGVPAEVVWGTLALILVYTAYVSEVYRAGIESVHSSQNAAARSLGLSHGQALRYVVIPQAVRRVIPPLLNDFIGLQKDTALVALIGVTEAFRQSTIDSASDFNFTPYLAAAFMFLLVTVPLTRLTDYLISRDRKRRQAAGVAV
jgi:polar amino acid transport system permease protein